MNKWFAFLAATAIAVPAHAQDARVDPDHIMTVLKDAGYPAEYFNTNKDYRQILSKAGNYQFLVEMYDCVDFKACQTLEFYANFQLREKPTKEKIAAYTGLSEDARASLDRRGDAFLREELDINVEGGLSDAQFIEKVKHWETMLADFIRYLASDQAAPAPTPAAATAPDAAAAPAPASTN